jgi:hypothetical protein
LATATSPSPSTTIDPTDIRLHTIESDNTNANYYSSSILNGLYEDAHGQLQVKPDIAAKLSESRLERVNQLLASNRSSEANSLAACRNIHKIQGHCPDWHEASVAAIRCAKPFLCGNCAAPSTRAYKFQYDHPYLYQHLTEERFSVLTFSVRYADMNNTRAELERAQLDFKRFMATFDDDKSVERGWYFFAAFDDSGDGDSDDASATYFQTTKFFAIHCGPKLPGWSTMAASWRSIIGSSGKLQVKLFDGHDGDLHLSGLKMALSGFEGYYGAISATDGQPAIHFSDMFRGYDICTPYGYFRGFDDRTEAERKATHDRIRDESVELLADGTEAHPDELPKLKCATCGKEMVIPHSHTVMTTDELERKNAQLIFGHSTRRIYGRSSTVVALDTASTLRESPHIT